MAEDVADTEPVGRRWSALEWRLEDESFGAEDSTGVDEAWDTRWAARTFVAGGEKKLEHQ